MIINPFITSSGSGGCANIVGATQTLITGSGTSYHYIPVSYYYKYSIGCVLLDQSELGTAKQYTGLELHQANSRSKGLTVSNQYIKMYHTTANLMEVFFQALGSFGVNLTLVNANPNMPVTDETLVHSGSWTKSGVSGWKALNFNTNNFCYNGTDNVLIFWVNDWGQYSTSYYPRWSASSLTADTNRGAYDYDDYTAPTSATRSSQRPHLKLMY